MKLKKDIRKLVNNFFYVISSNAIAVLVSILVILVVPKFIGVTNYGYLQLYLFYTSFVGFLHFGWNDGLYLRLGGHDYNTLDKSLYASQFYMLLFFQFVIAAFGYLFIIALGIGGNKAYVLWMTAICMVVVNVRYMLLFLLQATYRIKEYSAVTLCDRLSYLALIILLLTFGLHEFKYLIWVDIVGKVISLCLAVFYCKDIIFKSLKDVNWEVSINEGFENIRIGIKLMLSNVSGKLVIGNVRFGIESIWTIAIFGKLSLMLSVTTFAMVFIQSVGLVLFPFLRKIEEILLSTLYRPLRELLTFSLLIFLITYYPVSIGLKFWLPDYSDALKYLLILYPVIIFEGKMALLISTYLKVLRKETLLLKINLISLFLSFILTLISVYIFKNLDMAVYTIIVLVSIRSIISEIYLQKILYINVFPDIVLEMSFVWIFIAGNIYFENFYGFFIYIFLMSIYLFIKKNDMLKAFLLAKNNLFINY